MPSMSRKPLGMAPGSGSGLAHGAAAFDDRTGLGRPVEREPAAEFFHNVPTNVIKKLYNIYFMDFLMYNYTVDDYLSK